ncbi:helix-turn-helix domain-containing protein [Vibrio cholerae]|uniref:helix-turn-helix transcriptional regulator n=1 Tax=Gammaproteobacteria TaxID=1236 RepID=UPI0009B47BDE|nr:helix-turn-helix domain-containing protein [Vibrio cholerae]EGR1136930.1 helix-turn-helix domain-containing protein [Vibrio cholerae]ELJ8450146.1 helix-turn-helix domain-containing protein [Vibrio cholerae]NOF73832.1 helix-turn-helix domain-containing protein [Vibrio cholerae]TXZ01616.1 helix-turn-helix domain-containing protein [Vibrio cholerae]HCJ6873303.1 helix-turn-helix domain-containing protein [Vibrio cholerae]
MNQVTSTTNERLLTYQEVCSLTQISPATLRRYVQSGKFPSPIKLNAHGRSVRFRYSDITAWLSDL